MNPKRKIFITAFCLLGSLLAVLVFLIAPLVQGIQRDAGSLQAQKHTLEIFAKETQEIENFNIFSQDRREDIDSLHLLFVSPETPIPFIEFLEQYAKPLGIELTIVPGDPKQLKGDAWPSLELRVSSKTDYPAAFAFLKALEKAPFALEMKNITITAHQDRTEANSSSDLPPSGNVAFTFGVKVYTK